MFSTDKRQRTKTASDLGKSAPVTAKTRATDRVTRSRVSSSADSESPLTARTSSFSTGRSTSSAPSLSASPNPSTASLPYAASRNSPVTTAHARQTSEQANSEHDREREELIAIKTITEPVLKELEQTHLELEQLLNRLFTDSENSIDTSKQHALKRALDIARSNSASLDQRKRSLPTVQRGILSVLDSDDFFKEQKLKSEQEYKAIEEKASEAKQKQKNLQKEIDKLLDELKRLKKDTNTTTKTAIDSDQRQSRLDKREIYLNKRESDLRIQLTNYQKQKQKLEDREKAFSQLEKARKSRFDRDVELRRLKEEKARLAERARHLNEKKKKLDEYQSEYFGHYNQDSLTGRLMPTFAKIFAKHGDIAELIKATTHPMSDEESYAILRTILGTCDPLTRRVNQANVQKTFPELLTQLKTLKAVFDQTRSQDLMQQVYSAERISECKKEIRALYHAAESAIQGKQLDLALKAVDKYEQTLYTLLYEAGAKVREAGSQYQEEILKLNEESQSQEQKIRAQEREMAVLNNQVSAMENQISQSAVQLNKLRQEIASMNETLTTQASEFSEGISETTTYIVQMQTQIDTLVAEKTVLEDQVSAGVLQQQKLSQLESEKLALQQQVDQQEAVINRLKGVNSYLQASVVSLNSALALGASFPMDALPPTTPSPQSVSAPSPRGVIPGGIFTTPANINASSRREQQSLSTSSPAQSNPN